MSALARQFDAWIALQDVVKARELASLRVWGNGSAFLVALLAALAYVPGVRDLFQLRLGWALLAYLPLGVSTLGFGLWLRRGHPLSRRAWLVRTANTFYLEFFLAVLVDCCSVRGGGVMASILILTLASHGHSERFVLRPPIAPIGTLLALGCASWLAPSPAHVGVLMVAGGAGLTTALLLGTTAVRAARAEQATARLREAIQAQVLADRHAELDQLRRSLVTVLGCTHDATNALTAARLAVELRAATSASPAAGAASPAPPSEPGAAAGAERLVGDPWTDPLLQSLEELGDLLRLAQSGARAGADAGAPVEDVDVAAATRAVVATARARVPEVTFDVRVPPEAPTVARVRGGALALRRMLENLVLNACEGDGRRGASRVAVSLEADGSGLRVSVTDDGPGFAPSQLALPISAFSTTKPSGQGLGLFTSEKLARASDGTLVRATSAAGGAAVHLWLPVPPDAGARTSWEAAEARPGSGSYSAKR